jgi:iron complex transport system ATP-binding protein
VTVIRAEDLWCGYPGRPVLKGVSLEVRQGELIGVLGPNGSGKTTLLMALSGIIPFQRGRVELFGSPLEKLKPKDRALKMAGVMQGAEARFPFTCEEVVRMGRYPHQKRWQMDSAEDSAIVRRSIELTDTEELAERLITTTSGGEKQRVLMAKALAQDAPILLLDEAVSAMDVHRKLQIFRVLERLNDEDKLTVIAVLHDVNLAALFCRRLIFIKDGRVVADGPTDEVLTSEILEDVYQARAFVQEVMGTGKRQVVFLP